jgi:hypothetical protein
MHFPSPLRCSRGFGVVLGFSFGFGWVVVLVGFLYLGFVFWVLLMSLAPYSHCICHALLGFLYTTLLIKKKNRRRIVVLVINEDILYEVTNDLR